jgi:maleamate amidohydrolase
MNDVYQQRSYAQVPIGFGHCPGIVVVDYQVGFTEEQYPLGGAPLVKRGVENTRRLLDKARACGVPVANCYTAYLNEDEMPYWKVKAVRETFLHGHPCTELDPRIYDPDHDIKICKTGASIFFDTTVASYFIKQRVDTVIVTGCVTSGCIRASVIDSFSHRFRTIVPEDCVGDHDEGPHQDNLRDVGRRYADVSDADECIAYIEDWRRRNTA